MASQNPVNPDAAPAAALPIACLLTGEDFQQRGEEVAPLFAAATSVRELPDGYAFAFSPEEDSVRKVLDFVLAERACCPFFTFELSFPSPHEAIWLSLRGSEEIKAFVGEGFLQRTLASAE
jgi:hypothetical protein